jgi:hypothetical protein
MASISRITAFIILTLLLSAGPGKDVLAQKHYRYFYGTVVDESTGQPVTGANIIIRGTKAGTTTDARGDFSIYIDTLPVYMVISHLGYYTRTVLLDGGYFKMMLYLNPSVTELGEVEVKATLNEPFFKDNTYAVKDYEIDSGMVYMIIFRVNLSRFELICKRTDGDTVARSKQFHFMPTGLFRDCLGFMHVLSADSVYQVFREEHDLHLIFPDSRKKFDELMLGCRASTAELLFYRNVTKKGLSAEYFAVNKKNFQRTALTEVSDEKKLKMLRRNADDAQNMNSGIPDDWEQFKEWNFVQKILYKPVKTELYKIGNFICIFDIPESQIEFFDLKGNFSYKLQMKAEKSGEGRWTGDIIVDESDSRVYTTWVRNGTCTLFRVDLNSGELKKQIALEYPFPEKVRVYNNFVYYLYDIPGDPDNKMLYRQKF